jgi:GNAT superfamily N-acetyltransferase
VDDLGRALRFLWASEEALSDEVERLAEGTVLRTPSLAHYWSTNALRLEGPHPGLTLAGAEALVAEHVPAPYRHVAVEDEATAARLSADALAEGWKVDHELIMRLAGGPDRAPSPSVAVREGSADEVVGLLDEWFAEDFAEQGPEAMASLRAAGRRQHERLPWRRWVGTDAGGRPAAMCLLLARDGVAQVEDVFTRPDARGSGLGRAVVSTVLDEARAGGHDLVFLVADDDGWPKRLYAKLGFVALGRRAALHRDG